MTTTNIDGNRDTEFAPEIASALFCVYLFLFSSTSIGCDAWPRLRNYSLRLWYFALAKDKGAEHGFPILMLRKYLPFYHKQRTLNFALHFLYSFAKHSKLSIELIFIAFAFVYPLRLIDGEHEKKEEEEKYYFAVVLNRLQFSVIFSSSNRENAG